MENIKIPKIVHYCWFGRGEKNGVIQKCLESWKKYLGDFKFKEWNEDNFDIRCNLYVKQAYDNGKWAFVSDYVRLYALFTEGGIYLDTDVEITNYLDRFLRHSAFSGFESDNRLATAIMGAEKGNLWIKRLLDFYDDVYFVKENGKLDLSPNTNIITRICVDEFGILLDNSHQVIEQDVHIYPKEYFCVRTNNIENFTVHHFNASWFSREMLQGELNHYKKNYESLTRFTQKILQSDKAFSGLTRYHGKIAIYGLGILGKLLFTALQRQGIKVICFIDGGITNSFYEGIEVLTPDKISKKENIEVIIVTVPYAFDEISVKLSQITLAKIICIDEAI